MNETKLVWRERTSESKFIASVWACHVTEEISRTVLADPCTSIILVKSIGSAEVLLRGPETQPRNELLLPGYTWTAVRLQPGVLLKGFPVQKFINDALTIATQADSRFTFEGVTLQFPDYNDTESLIDQLNKHDILHYETSAINHTHEGISSRSYARLTKRATGLSPYKLQQIQRMHQALQLLKQGVSAVDVATELGFVDQAHLIRSAKQFLSHTPKELLHLPQNP